MAVLARRSIGTAVLPSLFGLAFHGYCADRELPVASLAASMPVRTLQLMQAEPDSSDSRRWIVWDEGVGEGQTARIALCRRSGQCEWTHIWLDAYAPVIRHLASWSTEKMSIFLVIYRQGAEAETAVVIGLDHGGSPHVLDQRDGAWIALASDERYLELNPESGSDPSKECLHWNGSALKLEEGRCSG